MIFEELTKVVCSSFKITLHSHKNIKAERKITWPNPEIGSDHLAEMRMHARLLARSQQGIWEGMWHSCNESLYLFPVQLMHLNSTRVSILANLPLFITLLCCTNKVAATFCRNQPWHPGSSLCRRLHLAVLSGGWNELQRHGPVCHHTFSPEVLTEWPERINCHFILCWVNHPLVNRAVCRIT